MTLEGIGAQTITVLLHVTTKRYNESFYSSHPRHGGQTMSGLMDRVAKMNVRRGVIWTKDIHPMQTD